MKFSADGSDFPSQVIERSIIITSERRSGVVHVNKAQHRKDKEIYEKTFNRKKSQG